jgi:hypothetical protein
MAVSIIAYYLDKKIQLDVPSGVFVFNGHSYVDPLTADKVALATTVNGVSLVTNQPVRNVNYQAFEFSNHIICTVISATPSETTNSDVVSIDASLVPPALVLGPEIQNVQVS